MKLPHKFLLFVLLLITPFATSAQNAALDYTQAYNICSPAAHQLAKHECNYARTHEGYYTQCMYQQGYSDDDNSYDSNYYDGYLASYKYCSSIAEQGTKEYCGYGDKYKKHYDKCMVKHGFNEYGESSGDDGGFRFDF